MQETSNPRRRINPRTTLLIVMGLLGLLATSSTVLIYGQESSKAFPSITNAKPSGTQAFAELLEADGYTVVQDRSTRPKVTAEDVVVYVELGTPVQDFGTAFEGQGLSTPQIDLSLEEHREQGGRRIVIAYPDDFGTASKAYAESYSEQKSITGNISVTTATQELAQYNQSGTILAGSEDSPIITVLANQDKTPTLYFHNGMGISNRYLDEADNANAYLTAIRKFVPKSQRIVFTEASFGNISNPNLVSDLGPWSQTAFRQFLLLALVMAIGIGIRFGFPVPSAVKERGVSELLGAMGAVLKRSKSYDQAAMILLEDAYERIREAARAPIGSSPSQLTQQAPENLAKTILTIRQNYGQKIQKSEWLQLSRTLERQLFDYESSMRAQTSNRNKLK